MNTNHGGYEPWARIAFALGALVLGVLVVIGSRPGGTIGVGAYLYGPPIAGAASALLLCGGLLWSLVRRPVLQRKRIVPFLVLATAIWISSFPFVYPSSHERDASRLRLRLPFEGIWITRHGGDTREANAFVLIPSRRFGFEFVRADGEGRAVSSRGEIVLAPAAGRVVSVVDGLKDGTAERSAARALGNQVVLEVGARRFLFLGNLESGSIGVRVGDEVEADQYLARVGASAIALPGLEPGVCVHVQDSIDPLWAEGVPVLFVEYLAGDRLVTEGVPQGGGGLRGKADGERVRRAQVRR